MDRKIFAKRKIVVGLIIFLIGTGIIGWQFLARKREKPQFQTARVERGTIVSSVSASGQIVTTNLIEVRTQASGLVKKVYVKNGDHVKKGDKIAEILLDQLGQQRNNSAWANYLAAKNNLNSAETALYSLDSQMWAANQKFINDAVARGLEENDPTYIQQRDDWLAAEAKYKNQQTVVAQAKAALNSAWLSYQLTSPSVVAPAEGVITGLAIAEGMVINSSNSDSGNSLEKIATIQIQGKPIASLNLSEMDIVRIQPGQKATITVDSFPEKTYTGKVISFDSVGTVTSGVVQYLVLLQFDTEAPELVPNMSVTANIIIAQKDNVLLVPSNAIQTRNGRAFARVLENNQVRLVPVEIGLTSETQTEIISGVNEGDLVVTGTISSSATSRQRESSPFGGEMQRMMRMVR